MNHRVFFKNILNVLYPYACIKCKTTLIEASDLCHTCWASLDFVRPPLCSQCGLSLAFAGAEHVCDDRFLHSRFVLSYTEASKPLFMNFKYHDQTGLADVFAKWILKLLPPSDPFWKDAQTLIPVPLHRFRLFKRQYNQAALLCHSLKKHMPHLTIDFDVLKRKRATPSQGSRSKDQRFKNVQGAFKLCTEVPPGIILVDDVWASGATFFACMQTLKTKVKVLSVAKT